MMFVLMYLIIFSETKKMKNSLLESLSSSRELKCGSDEIGPVKIKNNIKFQRTNLILLLFFRWRFAENSSQQALKYFVENVKQNGGDDS